MLLLNSIHFIDEYFFAFTDWATRHFGRTSELYYLSTHLLIFIFLIWVIVLLQKRKDIGILLAWLVQVIFFTNGLFHIFTTFLWMEYSPGLFSQLIIIPNFFLMRKMLRSEEQYTRKKMLCIYLFASLISVCIIGSLYIEMPI